MKIYVVIKQEYLDGVNVYVGTDRSYAYSHKSDEYVDYFIEEWENGKEIKEATIIK